LCEKFYGEKKLEIFFLEFMEKIVLGKEKLLKYLFYWKRLL
jgi:hypothetical protein